LKGKMWGKWKKGGTGMETEKGGGGKWRRESEESEHGSHKNRNESVKKRRWEGS
jgi:hypothetical protein